MKPYRSALFAAVSAGLAACGGAEGAWRDAAPAEAVVDSGYAAPPTALGAVRAPAGGVLINGTASPGAKVQLVTPTGQALSTTADPGGVWRLTTPAATEVRLYGLSMSAGDHVQQASGYLLETPDGLVAQLRAGAGAVILSPPGAAPDIRVVDFDQDGGAVVSGLTRPGAALAARIDRRPAGDGKADAQGRFAMAFTQPLRAGTHRIDVSGEGGGDAVEITITPTRAPQGRAFTAARTADGWRVDWITPGGGPQSTLILDRAGAGR